MKAYKHLVKHAIGLGLTVSVFDGEVWEVKRSVIQKDIFDCIESVEESQLRFRDNDNIVGWALVSPFGLADDETVIDHNCTDESKPDSIKFAWLDNWSNIYESSIK